MANVREDRATMLRRIARRYEMGAKYMTYTQTVPDENILWAGDPSRPGNPGQPKPSHQWFMAVQLREAADRIEDSHAETRDARRRGQ